MRNNKNRFQSMRESINSDKVKIIARGDNQKSFSRERKAPFYDIIYSILSRKGLSTAMELRSFFKVRNNEAKISQQGYLKQRKKLNPYVFTYLNDEFLNNFYGSRDEVKTWNGYVVFAIDGSNAEIPNSVCNREKYGCLGNNYSAGCARALISGLYDVLNVFFLDLQIMHSNTSEMKAAKNNLNAFARINIDFPKLILFDRNYPSVEFINILESTGISYIIRVKSSCYIQERKELAEDDALVKIMHTRARLDNIKRKSLKSYEELKQKKYTETRFIKGRTPAGEEETFITNLPDKIKSESIVKEYFNRWAIETAYNSLKNKMKLECVSGNASIYVEQDFLAQILVYNMAQDMKKEAEEKLKKEKKESKYPLRINENQAFGIFRNEMINLMLEDDNEKRGKKYQDLEDEMRNYYLPKRNLPSKERKFLPSNKYSLNLKPSF